MKRCLIALCLLVCLPVLHAQKTRFGQEPPKAKPGVDYPVKVHISGIRVRRYCDQNGCEDALHADAALDGQKVELTGSVIYGARAFDDPHNSQDRILPGDYRARLLKSKHKDTALMLNDEYELVLPDRTIWRCRVTGMFE